MNMINLTRLNILIVLFGLLFVAASSALAGDASAWKDSALSWQKQAKDTRTAVVNVANELAKTGDKGNPDVKGLIADAVNWLGEGDKTMAAADAAMVKNDYEKASNGYNMAWQYYVKAATAGLNAKSILSGL